MPNNQGSMSSELLFPRLTLFKRISLFIHRYLTSTLMYQFRST